MNAHNAVMANAPWKTTVAGDRILVLDKDGNFIVDCGDADDFESNRLACLISSAPDLFESLCMAICNPYMDPADQQKNNKRFSDALDKALPDHILEEWEQVEKAKA